MKNLKIWSLALALLVAMVGCEKPANEQQDEKPVIDAPFKEVSTAKLAEMIVGSWQLVEYAGQPAEFDVYIEFTADAFDLYERVYGYEYLYNQLNRVDRGVPCRQGACTALYSGVLVVRQLCPQRLHRLTDNHISPHRQ